MMLRSSTVSDMSPRFSPENMPERHVSTKRTIHWYAAGRAGFSSPPVSCAIAMSAVRARTSVSTSAAALISALVCRS